MKRAIIIHCWEGVPEYCWYPQVKKDLEGLGFQVQVPVMPDTDMPKFGPWMDTLRKTAGTPDEDLYLIGHSLGCITIMKYLESLPEGTRIGGAIFVGGYMRSLGYEETENFFTAPLDPSKVRGKAKHFVAIQSDNDPFVPMVHGDEMRDKLGAELIIKHAMGHFSGPLGDPESCAALPDVAAVIKTFSHS